MLILMCRTHCSDGLSGVAAAMDHAVVVRIEVEVPRVVRVVCVERTRPVVAVRANIVELVIPTVASSGQEETPSVCVNGLLFSRSKERLYCEPTVSSVLSRN